ncbi:MAG: hypothetical protein HY791_27175 [Deltaproteobacteria bacterium]|nr:hypothetical protein [Deltaproteobacteria bacterium]
MLLLLSSACAQDSIRVQAPDLGPELSFVGLLFFDEFDRFLEGSEVVEQVGAKIELDVEESTLDASTVWVVGFEADTLAGSRPDARPIKPSAEDEAGLSPDFSARGILEGYVVSATPEPISFRVGADWLPDCAQPVLSPQNLVADTNCASGGCLATVSSDGCRLDVETRNCDLESFRGRITPSGLVLSAPTIADCVPVPAEDADDVERRFQCGSGEAPCRVDILRRPFQPSFETKTVTIGTADPVRGTTLSPLQPAILFGPAVIEDRLAFASYSDPVSPADCTDQIPTLVHLNAALEQVSTSTLPPCVVDLEADLGGGLLALAVRPARLLRLDPNGRVLRAVMVAGDLAAHRVIRGAGRIYVVSLPRGSEAGRVAAHHLETLEEIWSIEVDSPFAAMLGANDDIGVVDGADVRFFDVDSGQVTFSVPVEGLCGGDLEPSQLLVLSESFILSTISETAGARVITQAGSALCSRAFPLEPQGAEPYAMTSVPGGLVAVGLTSPDREAFVALFDQATPRFLPGAVQIGSGIVSRLVGLEGDLYAAMGWSGEVARLTLR